MDDSAATFAEEAFQRLLIDGGLRKAAGLERGDLNLGLVVAKNQLMRGATLEALRTYTVLVLLDSLNPEFQIGLANCSHQLGEYHLALQAASAIVALDPRNPRGYYFSGRACLALGHYAEAEEDLTDAIKFGRDARDAVIVQEADVLLKKLAVLKG